MQIESRTTKSRIVRVFAVIAAILLVAGVLLFAFAQHLGPIARGRVVKALKDKYQSDVELKDLQISLFPHLSATGEDLVLRHHGRTDVPPLISIKRFSVETGFLQLFRPTKHIRNLTLTGLELHIPPRQSDDKNGRQKKSGSAEKSSEFVVDSVTADGTKLTILPKKAGKDPLQFDIYRLTLNSVGTDGPMQFIATLKNAKPPGDIHSTGEFGPWSGDDPGLTPVSGKYKFENADLSVFRGISGILSSTGKYNGELGRIEVNGETDTPDFTVRIAGNPIHLKTQFHSIVDGTDGDTLLQPVHAQFLKSAILANGGVTGTEGVKGKTVSLDVVVNQARLQDILRLAIKSSKNPMTGVLSFNTKLVIPPGEEDIADKLKLDGQFGIGAAKFTNLKVQDKVDTLSGRARGDTEDSDAERVVSNLKGRFKLNKGLVTFSKLSFAVPGASVRLDGTYRLRSEALDFHGVVRMEAKLSETTTGFKSFLLKAVDPFFRKKGVGSVIPIKIGGTRDNPSFGLDIGHKKD